MRRKRQELREFIEHRLLGPLNVVFLLLPVVLLAVELASFAALEVSQSTPVDVAEVEPAAPAPDDAHRRDVAREARLDDDASSALAAPLTGYGIL